MDKILLLGAGTPFHNHITRLKKEGYEVVAVDRDPDVQRFCQADAFVQASVDDVNAIAGAAREYKVDVIVAATEAGVLAASQVSKEVGLPGLPVEAAFAATDKSKMRAKWAAAGLAQPRFEIAQTPPQARSLIARSGMPCVIKPTRAWSSKGVSIVSDETEVDIAISEAFAIHDGPVIVESFIPGRLLTAEGFVTESEAKVVAIGDVNTQESNRHRVNMSLQYPSNFPLPVVTEATALIERAAMALGLQRTPFHCECMVSPDGVQLIEIGARGGGGHIFTKLYEPMTGIAGIVRQVRILLGEPVDPLPVRLRYGGCYKFLSAPIGTVRSIDGVDEAAQMPGVIDVGISIKPGDTGGLVTNDNARHAHVCTIGADRAEAVMLAAAASRRIRFS